MAPEPCNLPHVNSAGLNATVDPEVRPSRAEPTLSPQKRGGLSVTRPETEVTAQAQAAELASRCLPASRAPAGLEPGGVDAERRRGDPGDWAVPRRQ
jgi:hypothetical protein